MTDFLNEPLVQAILGAVAAVVVLGLFGWLKLRRDEKVVADFLKSSGVETRKPFRTTSEIAAGTNLHEARVRVICRKSRRIGAKHSEEDTWKLHD